MKRQQHCLRVPLRRLSEPLPSPPGVHQLPTAIPAEVITRGILSRHSLGSPGISEQVLQLAPTGHAQRLHPVARLPGTNRRAFRQGRWRQVSLHRVASVQGRARFHLHGFRRHLPFAALGYAGGYRPPGQRNPEISRPVWILASIQSVRRVNFQPLPVGASSVARRAASRFCRTRFPPAMRAICCRCPSVNRLLSPVTDAQARLKIRACNAGCRPASASRRNRSIPCSVTGSGATAGQCSSAHASRKSSCVAEVRASRPSAGTMRGFSCSANAGMRFSRTRFRAKSSM